MDKTKIQENQLLTQEERAACQEISTGGTPHSQRATALLALDEGATQIQAAEQAGLTKGQVRYWLSKFRQERLAIFPEEWLASQRPEPASESGLDKEEPPAPDPEASLPSQPVAQTPAGMLEAEKEGKVEPVKRSKKAKKAKKRKKGSKKKAQKTQPAEDSQIKSKASKKKKAKKKGGKKAKKGKAGKKGDKKKSKKKAKKKSKG